MQARMNSFVFIFGAIFASCLATPIEIGARAKEDDLVYVYYSRELFNGVYTTTTEDPNLDKLKSVFQIRKPTVILFHGWRDGYGADSNTYVRSAILSKLDANVIKVDWSGLAGLNYISARNAVPGVGRLVGRFLRLLSQKLRYSLDDVTVIGFSLGAHAAGNVGKELGGDLGQIIGLDPAGPLISARDIDYSLHPTDAKYVTAMHTNGDGLGLMAAVGHSDFYPNGGQRQPGCGADLLGGCAHNRAWEYLAESITDNKFVARKCNSYRDFQRDRCDQGFTLMGGLLTLDKSARGNYYLDTNSASPYARGFQ
ncbi:pancreatic lipase-related protein 2-like [Cylas formicarius]|uniref:pancreatic lipase-related protein 2-like n=1 Tax=Cylas formicarius TaxID=197179 RepID=UPI002958D239|nr:pancreatic lipase-related protein 2-like [Cylas formicarius]